MDRCTYPFNKIVKQRQTFHFIVVSFIIKSAIWISDSMGGGEGRDTLGRSISKSPAGLFQTTPSSRFCWASQEGIPPFLHPQLEISALWGRDWWERAVFLVKNQWANCSYWRLWDLQACGGILQPSWKWKCSLARPLSLPHNEAFTFKIKYLPTVKQSNTHQRRLSRPFSMIVMIIFCKYFRGSSGHVISRPHNRA